ncbi:MAG: hypothetical protein OXN15_00530 [Chloroflexota bacterium]|nr:hypothetical protein [Chloroflexota bacterium]MDE2970100.1 hypothetical protein [Chloroflexota bacterium]
MTTVKLTPREILHRYAELLTLNADYDLLPPEQQDEVSDGLIYASYDIEAQSREVGQFLLKLLDPR